MSLAPDLVQKIMQLPEPERAELAHRLLLSLEEPAFDGEWDSLWAGELERRSVSIERDNTIGMDWREAVYRVRRGLRQGKEG